MVAVRVRNLRVRCGRRQHVVPLEVQLVVPMVRTNLLVVVVGILIAAGATRAAGSRATDRLLVLLAVSRSGGVDTVVRLGTYTLSGMLRLVVVVEPYATRLNTAAMLCSRLMPPSPSPNACTGALPSPPFVSSRTAPTPSSSSGKPDVAGAPGLCQGWHSKILLTKMISSRASVWLAYRTWLLLLWCAGGLRHPVADVTRTCSWTVLPSVASTSSDHPFLLSLPVIVVGLILLLLPLMLLNRGSLLSLLLPLLLSLWRVVNSASAIPHTRLLSLLAFVAGLFLWGMVQGCTLHNPSVDTPDSPGHSSAVPIARGDPRNFTTLASDVVPAGPSSHTLLLGGTFRSHRRSFKMSCHGIERIETSSVPFVGPAEKDVMVEAKCWAWPLPLSREGDILWLMDRSGPEG
uniref:Uncharacterized protein n=1 Tax=Anopheles atroparvus TaxID=41427 RepID=A0A182J3H3_ANOAO